MWNGNESNFVDREIFLNACDCEATTIARSGNAVKAPSARPVLRVRPMNFFDDYRIPYVQYECRGCGRAGGLGITEEEAAGMWNGIL